MSERVGVQVVEIDGEDAGQRLDNFLIRVLKGLPRTRIYRIIRRGEVRINGKRTKPAQKLQFGDKVRIPPIVHLPAKEAQVAEIDLNNRVIFENDGLLVLNKPAGLASHGGSGIKMGAIETLRANRGVDRQLELVHRLDRDTSGCLMISKKRSYLRLLQDALRQKSISKRYLALVHGSWEPTVTLIDEPLLTRSSPKGEKITTVHHIGKPAQTAVNLIGEHAGLSLIEASPLTGRTHQIRVHTRHMRHPIVGDDKYGDELRDSGVSGYLGRKPRLMLHARSLSIPALGDWSAVEVSAEMDRRWDIVRNDFSIGL